MRGVLSKRQKWQDKAEFRVVRAAMRWFNQGRDPMRCQDDISLDRACAALDRERRFVPVINVIGGRILGYIKRACRKRKHRATK